MLTRSHIPMVSFLLALGAASAVEAGHRSALQCQSDVQVVRVGKGSAQALAAARGSGRNPLDELRTRCLVQPYDFVAEDRTALLRGVRLARLQTDSVAIVTRAHVELQKAHNDKRGAEYSAAMDTGLRPPQNITLRDVFLTPEMKSLRERYADGIRAVLQPEQLVRFERNLEELKKRDVPG